jgi:hypothetical protein
MRRLFSLAMALSLAAFGQTASNRGRIPPDTNFLQPFTDLGQDVKASKQDAAPVQLKLIHFAEDGD